MGQLAVEPTRAVPVQVYGSLFQLPGVAIVRGSEAVADAHLPKGSIFYFTVPGAVSIRGDGCRPQAPYGGAPLRSA